jgi:hypothetical protein
MNKQKILGRFLLSLFILLIIGLACEYDGPDPVWSPNYSQSVLPTISRIEPVDSKGALTIHIIGTNFSPVVESNSVYISGEKVEIKNASETEIVIYRPAMTGDSLRLKVVVKGAFSIAESAPYRLDQMISKVDAFGQSDDVRTIAIDAQGNLYAASRKIIYKVTPEGVETEWGSFAGRISLIRSGPDGYLYVQKYNSNSFSRVPPEGGDLRNFVSLPKKSIYFDFDSYGNIFLGGSESGIVLVKSDQSSAALGIYDEFEIKALRVFEGYIYVAAGYTGNDAGIPTVAIWKTKIVNQNGDIEGRELVYNWANAGAYSESEILDLTFSLDGDMYIGTDNASPVLIVHKDGSTEPLYKGLILSPATNLVWGNGNILYVNRGASYEAVQVVEVEMGKPGAPYYGRTP